MSLVSHPRHPVPVEQPLDLVVPPDEDGIELVTQQAVGPADASARAKVNGRLGPSEAGATGRSRSLTRSRGPKYPANGPQMIARSTSRSATASTSFDGGLGSA